MTGTGHGQLRVGRHPQHGQPKEPTGNTRTEDTERAQAEVCFSVWPHQATVTRGSSRFKQPDKSNCPFVVFVFFSFFLRLDFWESTCIFVKN